MPLVRPTSILHSALQQTWVGALLRGAGAQCAHTITNPMGWQRIWAGGWVPPTKFGCVQIINARTMLYLFCIHPKYSRLAEVQKRANFFIGCIFGDISEVSIY